MPNKQEPKKSLVAPKTSTTVRKVSLNTDPTAIPANINPGAYNQFQSFLAKKNMVGDPRMGTNEGRKAYTDELIKEYNSGENIKKYPTLAITPEAIESVQKYHQLSDPNLKVDKWVGPETSQLRYPSMIPRMTRKNNDPNSPDYNVPIEDTLNVDYGNKQYKLPATQYNKGAISRENLIDPTTGTTPFKTTPTTTVQARKNGGLIKGYALGGDVDPNEFQQFNGQNSEITGLASGALNSAIPGAGTAYGIGTGMLGKQTSKMSEVDPTTGKFMNKDKAQNAGLMNAAFNMSGLGMVQTAMDPNKSLKEKALSIGTYGISDMIGNKKNVDKMEAKNIGIVDEQKKQEQARLNAVAQEESLARQMAQRTASYKDGGLVDGNAALQKKTVYPAKKASPKAPMPPKSNQVVVDKKGLEQQKKTLGYKDGGKIEGKGSGTSDSITATVKQNSFVVPAKNSDKAEVIRKVVLKAPNGKANLKQSNGAKVKLSNGEHLFTPKEVEKIETVLGDDILDKLAPNSAKAEDVMEGEKNEMELAHGGLTPEKARTILHEGIANGKPITDKQRRYFGWVSNQKSEGGMIGYAKGGPIPGQNKSTVTTKSYPKPSVKRSALEPDYLTTKQINSLDVPLTERAVNANLETPNTDLSQDKTPSSTSGSKSFGLGDVSSIAENAIPFLQAGYGLSQLKKMGKRPVGEIDKDYLASINKAQGNVELANAQAKYGFTPEEQALLNSENQNITNAQRFQARNLSGGSAGNAYNMQRGASNNAFDRALKAKVANRDLMLQKQNIAQDKQAYLDNLIANKANMSRTLFNDKMNAFQQNQQAGSGLLAAGLGNIISGKRYQDELAAMKETEGIRNSTYNSIGQ